MCPPDIYIVGAQKSGTTTLYDWISQHPEIYAHPLAKDYPFFSNKRTYHDGTKQFYSFTKSASDNQLVLGGDANALYASLAPQRMYKVMPNAQLIAILRNPVDRAYSAYRHAVERLLENRSFEQAVTQELDGMKYKSEDGLYRDYLAHGHYQKQLKRVKHFFDSEQIKIIFFEDLKQQPLQVIKKIFQDINLSEFIPEMKIKNRTKGGARSRLLAKILSWSPSSRIVRSTGKMMIPFSIRTGVRRKLTLYNRTEQPWPKLPDHIRKCLDEYYFDDIKRLESLLGYTIPSWFKK